MSQSQFFSVFFFFFLFFLNWQYNKWSGIENTYTLKQEKQENDPRSQTKPLITLRCVSGYPSYDVPWFPAPRCLPSQTPHSLRRSPPGLPSFHQQALSAGAAHMHLFLHLCSLMNPAYPSGCRLIVIPSRSLSWFSYPNTHPNIRRFYSTVPSHFTLDIPFIAFDQGCRHVPHLFSIYLPCRRMIWEGTLVLLLNLSFTKYHGLTYSKWTNMYRLTSCILCFR